MFKKFSQEILSPQNGLGLSSIESKEIQDTFTDQDLSILSKINEFLKSLEVNQGLTKRRGDI